ncbi:SigE family RNA polymerase sigma factor [Micromonospora sp. NBC_01699]|uniref:SigE family RNA polymerase sigma factor n=1 Tax=Micromonospora sp. NBC_01699 TaxID=2975984 RepID=UPI002E2B24E9|nr:SigE family RNA polymerase sigma factor [Micromonospora sp. NBC_01699]
MQAELEREYVEFVTARLARMQRIAYLLCGDAHRADDLVQQTFTTLYVQWRRVRAVEYPDAYVRTMLVRTFLSEKRLAWSSRVDLTDSVPERITPEGPGVEDRAVLRDALSRVPKRQRAVLVLRFLCDLPVDEVAELLGCSPGTVKSQTSHGLAALRRLLGAETLAAWDPRGVKGGRVVARV